MSSGAQIDFSKYESQPSTPAIDFSKYESTPALAAPAKRTWLDSVGDFLSGAGSKLNPITGIKGAAQLAAHPIDTYVADAGQRQAIMDQAEKSFKSGDYAGGIAHTINSLVPFLGAQMDEAGNNIASGQVAKGVGQSVGLGLNLATPELVKGAGNVMGKVVPPAAQALAERMYQTALKPPPGSNSLAEVKNMVSTGLDKGIPISEGGAAKLNDLVGDLNDKVQAQIKAGSNAGATVNKYAVASRLGDTAKKFSTQVNPESDLNAVSNAGNEFLRNQPTDIPASEAQALKSGTYKQLGDKSYGELSSATEEAQKALARGLKEELEAQFPEIKSNNAQAGDFYQLKPALERAVRRINNRDLLSLGGKVVSGAAGSAAGAAGGAEGAALGGAGALALHYALTDPFVQSRLAIAISHASKGSVPLASAAAKVASYADAIGNVANGPASGDQGNQ